MNSGENKIQALYRRLSQKHGPPRGQWQLWCKRPKTLPQREEVVIGAILTQNTNWKNVSLAMSNLQKHKVASLKKIYLLGKTNINQLKDLIKPAGFYNQKANYLLEIAKFMVENGGINKVKSYPARKLRSQLLVLRGIGPETADSILLYALDKPAFVIDEYTRRLVKKEGLADDLSYNNLQGLFSKNLPPDYRLFQNLHALIVIEGKTKISSQ